MDFGLQIQDIVKKVDLKKINPFRQTSSANESENLDYAYPCENYISVVISNPASKYSLKRFFDSKIKSELAKIVGDSIEVTAKSSPRLYGIIRHCCVILSIDNKPKYYICPKLKGINSLTVGDDENPALLISPLAVANLSNSELSFIIGHELGHVAQKNLICHTVKGALDTMSKWSDALGPVVTELIEVPLNKWYRCSEYTADRAGLLCCGNIQSALSVFDKASRHKKSVSSIFDSYNELSCDHPIISNRIKELQKFSLNNSVKR